MIYNFCTLFDKRYLSRGLLLYESLLNVSQDIDFNLYVFAFDDESENYLKCINLNFLTVIPLKNLENESLLKIKFSRTPAEYCWTCTPQTISYCFENFNLENCTYIDSDIFFYSSYLPIFNEIAHNSVGITRHNYTKKYDQSKTSGIFCVQFVYFKNDKNGRNVLNDWKNSCLDWCYARLEDGKFGDQKYLDYWPQKYNSIHIIENLGAGIAPWNVQQFIVTQNQQLILINKKTNNYLPIIFYHFHGLKFNFKNSNIEIISSKFYLDNIVKKEIYKPYVEKLFYIEQKINSSEISYNEIIFQKLNFFIILFLELRLFLKKFSIPRKINSHFNKSSRY
jgi:hypothetical protein